MDDAQSSTTTQQTVAALPRLPASWPGAFGLYKFSKQAVKPYAWTLVGLFVLTYAVALVVSLVFKNVLIRNFFEQVVGLIITPMITMFWLAGIRGQQLSFSKALDQTWPVIPKLFVVELLVGLSYIVSFVLLVVPFFFVLPRLVLAPYYVIDQNTGIMEALQTSWRTTKGHSASVWGIIGVSILMVLLMITIIGIPFAIYFLLMYSAAIAVLYEFINHQPAAVAPSADTN